MARKIRKSYSSYDRAFNIISPLSKPDREIVLMLDPNNPKDQETYRNITNKPYLSPTSTQAQIKVAQQYKNDFILNPNKLSVQYAKKKGLDIEITNSNPKLIRKNQRKTFNFKPLKIKPKKAKVRKSKKKTKRKKGGGLFIPDSVDYFVDSVSDVILKSQNNVLVNAYTYREFRLILKFFQGGNESYISTAFYPVNAIDNGVASLLKWIANLGGDEEYYNGISIDSYDTLTISYR